MAHVEERDAILEAGFDPDEYQLLDDWEHLDKRPENIIGSIIPEVHEEHLVEWGIAEGKGAKASRDAIHVVVKEVEIAPALPKIFEEILQNAIDHSIKDDSMTNLKVTIDNENPSEPQITVWNDGEGIPCYIHPKTKLHVPTMVFSKQKAGSNFHDDKERMGIGKNGYGAKATNFFSKTFDVKTLNTKMGKQFVQKFHTEIVDGKRRIQASKPKITTSKRKSGFTEITFVPDLPKFGADEMTAPMIAHFESMVWDAAACTDPRVKVSLNGKVLPLKHVNHYASMLGTGNVASEKVGDRFEVCVVPLAAGEERGLNIGFVNGARCSQGTHVNHVRDRVAAILQKLLRKKLKNETSRVTARHTETLCHVVVRISVDKPAFESQCKREFKTSVKQYGFTWKTSDSFTKAVGKGGYLDALVQKEETKGVTDLMKVANRDSKSTQDKMLRRSIVDIPNLRDACNAGKKGNKCVLILAEGLSAISSAEDGLEEIGSDNFGLLPLKGKIINAKKAKLEHIIKNTELQALVTVLGLVYGCPYDSPKHFAALRYQRVWLMMDQDVDGSHIVTLFYNWLHEYFKPLLEARPDYVCRFWTPLIRAVPKPSAPKSYDVHEFPSKVEFLKWKDDTEDDLNKYEIIYQKGLGTSEGTEMRRYMKNYRDHTIRLGYTGAESDAMVSLMFDDKKSDLRKELLSNEYDAEAYVDYDMEEIPIEGFIRKEMLHFSMADNFRSIPSAIDGLKDSQRKALYTMLTKNISKRTKVAEVASTVTPTTLYEHGETSMADTVAGMAQEHTGTNNINLFYPSGKFGSRSLPPSEHAQPRYIYTYLNKIAKFIFIPDDFDVTTRRMEEERLCEPLIYVPILPFALVNGTTGIGTGWSTDIPSFNPMDLVRVQRSYIDSLEAGNEEWVEQADALKPWYAFHDGRMVTQEGCYESRGRFTVKKREGQKLTDIHITELPVGVWTTDYVIDVKDVYMMGIDGTGKKNGKKNRKKPAPDHKRFILDDQNRSTGFKVDITFVCDSSKLEQFLDGDSKRGKDHPRLCKALGMSSNLNRTNMHAFDFDDQHRLKKFVQVSDFYKAHGKHRVDLYKARIDYQIQVLEKDLIKLQNEARFVEEVIDDKVNLGRKRQSESFELLQGRSYASDKDIAHPPKPSDCLLPVEDDDKDHTYHYLYRKPMGSMTLEKMEELSSQITKVEAQIEALKTISIYDLWRQELGKFEEEYEKFVADREKRAAISPKQDRSPNKRKREETSKKVKRKKH